ncbi:MAG: DUF5666 domain-containing protein [Desulfobaccales bacterium]
MKRACLWGLAVCLVVFLAVTAAPAVQKFYGTVEKMPASGWVGEWVISGRTVQVVRDTKVKQDDGPLQVGAYVEVEGVEYEGKFIATELETEKKK